MAAAFGAGAAVVVPGRRRLLLALGAVVSVVNKSSKALRSVPELFGFTPDAIGLLLVILAMAGFVWRWYRLAPRFVCCPWPQSAIRNCRGRDHWSRWDFVSRPSQFVQRTVPFVLYGLEVLTTVTRPERIVGGHVDIVSTLVELTAPSDFAYHAFSRNLLDPTQPQIGYGNRTVITPEIVVDVSPQGQVQDAQGRLMQGPQGVEELRQRYRHLHALCWWRVMNGSGL